MRIAIVKLSALGDIVNSMFVLQFIKKYHPTSKIDWIVEKRFKGILENNPHIDQIQTINLNEAKKNKSLTLNNILKFVDNNNKTDSKLIITHIFPNSYIYNLDILN